MTAPGELNRRLVLQAPVETADGAGGVDAQLRDRRDAVGERRAGLGARRGRGGRARRDA